MEIEHLREEVSRIEARLLILQTRARRYARDMQNGGKSSASREVYGRDWEKARRESKQVMADLKIAKARLEEAEAASLKNDLQEQIDPTPTEQHSDVTEDKAVARSEEVQTPSETSLAGDSLDRSMLAENINRAYANLSVTNRNLTRAKYLLQDYESRRRSENAEVLLDAKSARTAEIFLEGIFNSDKHRNLLKEKTRAELANFDSRLEIERLKLLVRLTEPTTGSTNNDI